MRNAAKSPGALFQAKMNVGIFKHFPKHIILGLFRFPFWKLANWITKSKRPIKAKVTSSAQKYFEDGHSKKTVIEL